MKFYSKGQKNLPLPVFIKTPCKNLLPDRGGKQAGLQSGVEQRYTCTIEISLPPLSPINQALLRAVDTVLASCCSPHPSPQPPHFPLPTSPPIHRAKKKSLQNPIKLTPPLAPDTAHHTFLCLYHLSPSFELQ